jgi:hypothetical protein
MIEPLPKRISISIGGYFGTSFGVEGDASGNVVYTRTERREKEPWEIGSSEEWETQSEPVKPTPARWAAFRGELDRLNVWSWQPKYPNPGICDGTGWIAEIVYPDKSIVSGRSNCFPGNNGRPVSIADRGKDGAFREFCRAVSVLVGRTFR